MTTEKNFNLKLAPIGIRKAAALKGIQSGRFVWFAPDTNETYNPILGKAFNKNYPNGIEISLRDSENAMGEMWEDIKFISLLKREAA